MSKKTKPFPLRLGIMKPYLQSLSFNDPNCKGLTDFIQQLCHAAIIKDKVEGEKYLMELRENKKSTSQQSSITSP